MNTFSYQAPSSVSLLLAVLAAARAASQRSQILAGGTDLIVQMKTLDLESRLLVDIKKVPEAMRISIDEENIYLGAGVPACEITAHAELKSLLPGLVEGVYYIGSTQIQGRATIGGNLSNASPAGDTIPALVANNAQCLVQGPNGERRIPIENYVTGVQSNCLAVDEFLQALLIARPDESTSDAYIRFTPRTEMDIAVVGAGVSLTLDAKGLCTKARVGLGAVATTVLQVDSVAEMLVGSTLDEATITAAGVMAAKAGSPISDKRGSAEFRRKLSAVLVKRAIRLAQQRIENKRS